MAYGSGGRGSSGKAGDKALVLGNTAKQWTRGEYNGLHAWSREGNCGKIKALLDRFDIDMIAEDGFTPLVYAIQSGVLRAVKVLLDNGANVRVVCAKGVTALICAVESGCLEAAKMLIQANSDLEAMVINGDGPLHLAADWGHTAVMAELVAAGANVNSRGHSASTPLYISAREGFPRHGTVS